jgi:hypothetical protein
MVFHLAGLKRVGRVCVYSAEGHGIGCECRGETCALVLRVIARGASGEVHVCVWCGVRGTAEETRVKAAVQSEDVYSKQGARTAQVASTSNPCLSFRSGNSRIGS